MLKQAILFFAFAILVSCSGSKKNDPAKGRMEITPFKETEIVLKDTMSVKTAFSKTDSGRVTMYSFNTDYNKPQLYLNASQFELFQNAVSRMIRDPKSKIWLNDIRYANAAELREKFVKCDSVEMISFDAKGEEVFKNVMACDSTSLLEQINKISYYETWYFNPKNNMIERDVLGYSIWSYLEDKNAWHLLFNVYKDDESRRKAKKFIK